MPAANDTVSESASVGDSGRRVFTRRRAVIAAAAGALLVAWFFGALSFGAGEGETVIVLSPHWEGITKEFGRAFAEWHRREHGTAAHIEVLDVGGGTGAILRHIESSYRATPDGIGVDVIFGGGAPAHQSLASKGFLSRPDLSPEVTSRLARAIGGMALHDVGGRWFGAAMSGFGIVSNEEIIRRREETGRFMPRVAAWEDLAHPRLHGWVASGDPTSSGAVHACFEVILQAYGFERGYSIITRIAGNVSAFDVGGNAAARSVGVGQSAFGLSIDMYALEQVARAGPENVAFILPERLTVITPDPIAILKGAPHPDLARRFVEFVLSTEGQKLWYVKAGEPGGPREHGLNRLPVIAALYDSGLPTEVTVNPFTWESGFTFDQDLAGARWRLFEDLMRATILDVHSELREAWRAVIDAGCGEHPELVEELGRAPVSGEEVRALSRRWRDATLRRETVDRWSRFAREKFRAVRAKARSAVRR